MESSALGVMGAMGVMGVMGVMGAPRLCVGHTSYSRSSLEQPLVMASLTTAPDFLMSQGFMQMSGPGGGGGGVLVPAADPSRSGPSVPRPPGGVPPSPHGAVHITPH